MAWLGEVLPEALTELDAVSPSDRVAIDNAIEKLALHGDRLGAPHSSAIKGAKGTLRELRPRTGRSRWRAFYRRVGDRYVVSAIGPEASVNPTGFRRSVSASLARLDALSSQEYGGTSHERR